MIRNPIFTVGHSTRAFEELLDALREQRVEVVVDIRKLPGSNRCPQFNQDDLRPALSESGIDYRWIEGLTGRRPVSKTVPFKVNAWWRDRSFHNYADHAIGQGFAGSLEEVCGIAEEKRVALMCSEAVWWRCHRRIIADHLMACGRHVSHIMGPGRVVNASLSDGARKGPEGGVTYPAQSK